MKPVFFRRYHPAALIVLVIFFALCMLGGCSDPIFLFSGEDFPYNCYVLDSGKAYRSSQPTGVEMTNAIEFLGLKTVINLRGAHPGVDWYDEEADACQQANVTLVSFAMSSGSLPEPDMLKGIVNTLKTADYPILIHCAGGSDRTGAVSAIYKMLIDEADRSVAREQLSPLFFHYRFNAPYMDELVDIYEPTDEWLTTYTEEYDQLPGAVTSSSQ